MKKRAMKKYIPSGIYCHDPHDVYKVCPWWKCYDVQKIHRKPPSDEYAECEFGDVCTSACHTDKSSCCQYRIVGCDYIGVIDKNEDTLLWDQCKICNVRNTR